MMARYTLRNTGMRPYHRESTLSKAEIMLIMILFHDSGYRCFKQFYLEKVCKHLRHLFPGQSHIPVSQNLKEKSQSPQLCSSRKSFWGSAPESVLQTVLLFVSVATRGYTSIRHLKVQPREANVQWAGSSDSNFTLSVTRKENCSIL